MDRAEVITRLRGHAGEIAARGLTALHLFGSTARDAVRADSDVDLFLDLDPTAKFSLVDLAALEGRLADLLGVEVDLTTRDSLHPRLRDGIERSAELVL